jgi:hypothetical protein
MTWGEFIELAFTEITEYGASSAQVARRLLAPTTRWRPGHPRTAMGYGREGWRYSRNPRAGACRVPRSVPTPWAWAEGDPVIAHQGLESLLAVVLVSAIAPMIVSILPGPRVPQVVVLMFGGILLAEIGLSDGVMIPANAAAMAGAGVLSALVCPSIAVAVARRDRGDRENPAAQAGLVTGSGSLAGPDQGHPADSDQGGAASRDQRGLAGEFPGS